MALDTSQSESVDETETNISSDEDKKSSKRHSCTFKGCSATFTRPYKLNAHVAVHLGLKPYICDAPNCTKGYTTFTHLKRHKENFHQKTETKTFRCEYEGCNQVFKAKQNQRRHFIRTHKLKTCNICKITFMKQHQLKYHMYTHTNDSPFKCKVCEITLPNLVQFNRHKRKHREYICTVGDCFQEFPVFSLLRKHLSTHPPDFNCFYCKKGYRSKKHLKLHIERHLIGDVMKRKNILKPFSCSLCKKILAGKASLKRHIKTMHENFVKPVKEKKPREERKDKGIPKHALSLTLSGVAVNPEISSNLIQGKTLTDDELIRAVKDNKIREKQIFVVGLTDSE